MSARTGTATVMFTDVVGSTRLRAALGEERSDELRRAHDQLLTACVSRADGTAIKGGGDGIMARNLPLGGRRGGDTTGRLVVQPAGRASGRTRHTDRSVHR